MNETDIITLEQKARIYCVKHGHAKYFWQDFGYVHCGRCGELIGDALGSVFRPPEPFIFVNPRIDDHDYNCDQCMALKKTMNKLDNEILNRLIRWRRADKSIVNYNEMLHGLGWRFDK